jgi:cyclopropane fatty-acyl-phospholipid synthase-like methyltransferase
VAQVVVGELLARSLHVHAGERVLDVAGGAGNTALAAAWERVRFSARTPRMAFKRNPSRHRTMGRKFSHSSDQTDSAFQRG